jgi:hypothetical protein
MPRTSLITAAVVGHANVGKTSLMRTLLRDSQFGAVSDHPGTTRHVEGGALVANGEAVVTLYDTTGLEDSIGLLEILDESAPKVDGDGIDRLRSFLNNLHDYPLFRQEAKVIRQLLNSDLLFYVIDCREPVLGKYCDELKILQYSARPVIPILNFAAAANAKTDRWCEQLARLNLHTSVTFDTVAYSFEGEKRLYQKMQSLLSSRYDALQRLIDERQQQWQLSYQAATRCIAELLIDTTAYRIEVPREQVQIDAELDLLYANVRRAEAQCVKTLLQLFRFSPEQMSVSALPIKSDRWQADLFDPDTLRLFSGKAGSAVMKGAAAGAGIDLVTGGLSLGAATAIGAGAGLLISGGKRFGRDISARVRGYQQLCIEDATLQILWHRQRQLLNTLLDRGHASQQPLQFGELEPAPLPAQWEKWLATIRSHRHWTKLDGGADLADPERERLLQEIASQVGLE